ncbi:MAG: glycoside hydrolase family 18 protein, partial [Clostridia bacterium]|nr:glycoside hydrolase family 18 protein [Clostridia bacterium]
MKRIKKALSLLLCLAMLATMTVTGLSFSASADTGKELIVYFANWDIYSLGKNGEVASIPWDRVTYINHAFFQIDKNGEGDFSISSTDSWADMENMGASQVDPTLTLNHFSQYEHFSALYPDVNIMISIGGWTKCGYFSEMASTASGRSSFVQSCIDLMNTYSWIDGIDVDWEYPGVAREPEAGNPSDQGCPVVGDDFTNYTLLLQDMRQGFDSAFGAGAKKLTVCESVNYNTLAHQDCANFHQYVDLINVMTYDMTGTYDPVTGHQAQIYSADPSGYSVDSGVNYLLDKGVPASKINIGSPVYSHGWGSVVPDANGNVLGVAGSSTGYQGDLRWNQLKKLQNKAVAEGEEGWHYYFDNEAKASYLYNDNPNSNYYQNFFTYDSEAAIVSKAQYINEKGLAGIILWEAGGDSLSDDAPFISLLASSLGIYEGQVPAYTGADIEDPEVIDSGEPDENAFQNPIYEVQAATGWDFVTFPTGTQIYYKGAIYESINDGSNDFYGNLPDGQWGDGCWKKICDVKPYVSQEENGGTWAYVANKDDHVLYNPDRDVNADLWLALADNDNMANNAPDGIWGHSIWKYETTIILLEAPGGIKEYINEAEVGTGSKSFPAGTQIYYNDAIWESKSPSANDAADNMPGGAAGDAYWKKVVDLVNYGDGIADAGSYVFYNPDGDYTAQVYLSLNGANTDPAADATNWELASTVTLIYHPKYADGATVATLEADPLFFGEFQTRPFMKDGVEVSSYPAGAVVSYNGKYYENYVSGSSAWDDGWEPNVHGNWHEIYITQEGDDRIPTMQCPIYEIENYLNGNTPYATYPTGTLVYYNGRVWKSNMDTADNWTGNLPDGEWGDAVWTEMFVVKPYISQEENGG